MKPIYPLRLFFDCSTAHLSPAARAWLDMHADAADELIAATPYGWFMWADEQGSPDRPSDLSAIVRFGRKLGAEYLLFDRDAPENDALPSFETSG